MKFASYTHLESENYIRENNLIKIFSIYLCCYQIDFYNNNPNYYFDCFCFVIK